MHKLQKPTKKPCPVKYKQIRVCQEDILNLKCAIKRIMYTLTPNYEALEIFTLQHIIDQYEKK